MQKPNFILASASAGRATILQRMNITFTIDPADIDEENYHADSAEELVKMLAFEKAKVVANRHVGSLIIAADTLIVSDEAGQEVILSKPVDTNHATQMLQRLSAKTHRVITGLCVYRINDGVTTYHVDSETTYVTFKPLQDEIIASYVASGEPMGKSGSYGIQGQAREFVEKIDGQIDNVVGLPGTLLTKFLQSIIG